MAVDQEQPVLRALEVFISYSHKDERLRAQLDTHLALLQREGVLQTWHDRKISAGAEWAGQIDAHLSNADIILLLVSPDFLASNYCWDVEVQKAVARHVAGQARVIPIVLRPVDWLRSPLGKLQALPKDAKPVTTWSNRDAAWMNVADGLRRALEEFQRQTRGRLPPHAPTTRPSAPPAEAPEAEPQQVVSPSQEPGFATPRPAVLSAKSPDAPELVHVAAGPFLMGTSDAEVKAMLARYDWAKEIREKGRFSAEQPQHAVTLPAFEIGRYPVTNAEYAAFVQAAGHAPPSHWRGGSLPEGIADHPVVNVSWRDAGAYVAWLAGRTGQPYRLPTEAEWEKAARGADARLWPWGNEWDPARANCKPQGPGTTTLVGQYSPAGDSPYGCADMAGNVWQWCSSLWGKDVDKAAFGYPYRADDGREDLAGEGFRVLRGGSWYDDNPGMVRCGYRPWNAPGRWNDYVGFRVARGSLR